MSEEELININGIREDLYQAMQIGDITLNSKHSQELYDFMNYQDKEIERLNNIINELEKCVQNYIYAIEPRGCSINYNCEYDSEEDYINAMKEQSKLNTFKFILDKIKELKGSDKE